MANGISSPRVDAFDRLSWLVNVSRSVIKRGDDVLAIRLLDKLIAVDKGWSAVEYAAYYVSREKEKSALKHLEKLRTAIAKGECKPSPSVDGTHT